MDSAASSAVGGGVVTAGGAVASVGVYDAVSGGWGEYGGGKYGGGGDVGAFRSNSG